MCLQCTNCFSIWKHWGTFIIPVLMMQISCKSPGDSALFCVGLWSCNAAGNFNIEFLPWVFPSELAEVHSAHHCALRPHEAKDFLQVSPTCASSEAASSFYTVIYQNSSPGKAAYPWKPIKWTSKWAQKCIKNKTPLSFPYCWIFLKNRTTTNKTGTLAFKSYLLFPETQGY